MAKHTDDDPDYFARVARLRDLDVDVRPRADLDQIASDLAQRLNAPLAMVNLPRPDQQLFAGWHAPDARSPALKTQAKPDRSMPLGRGACPVVIRRKLALPLTHLLDYLQFVGNPVINEYKIISYIGGPIIDPATGLGIGTVCAVDTAEHEWGKEGVDVINQAMADATRAILPPQ